MKFDVDAFKDYRKKRIHRLEIVMQPKQQIKDLPPYTIRESARAKRVTLRIQPRTGLEVVVPKGFDSSIVPQLIQQKQGWIDKMMKKIAKNYPPPNSWDVLPTLIELEAMGREFTVNYVKSNSMDLLLKQNSEGRLTITGQGSLNDYSALLTDWLKQQGKQFLPPMLRALSRETGLDYARCQVRSQRTRWGSCSRKGTISLNCKLLFLPVEHVRYVMLHELCHVKHMNHSPAFWNYLQQLDPNALRLDKELDAYWPKVPYWVA